MKEKKLTLANKRFRAVRRKRKLSVSEFALLIGYSKESIYKKESGEMAVTKRDLLILDAIEKPLEAV